MKNFLNPYFEKNSHSESTLDVVYKAKKHWISFIYPVLLMLIGIIGVLPLFFGMGWMRIFGIGLLYLFFKGLITFLNKLYTKIYITQDHITISEGFLASSVNDISLAKLEGSYLGQNLLGKLLNYGTFMVTTGAVTQYYTIKSPMEFRKYIITQPNN